MNGEFDAAGEMDRANACFQAGNLAEAEELCLSVVGHMPENPRARHLLAFMALNQGKNNEALDHLQAADDSTVDNPLFFMHRGIAQSLTGKVDDSIGSFSKAIELKDDVADLHGNLARSLNLLGRRDDAIAAAQKALALDQSHLGALDVLADAEAAKGRPDAALAAVEKALSVNPGYLPALFKKGGLLISQARFEEAVDVLQHIVKLAPGKMEAWANLGFAFNKLNRAKEAVGAFEKAVELNPVEWGVWEQLARAYELIGDVEKARDAAEKVLAVKRGSIQARLVLARCLWRENNLLAAELKLLEILELNPEGVLRSSSEMLLGQVRDRLGRATEAFDTFKKANAYRAASKEWRSIDPNRFPVLVANFRNGLTKEVVESWNPYQADDGFIDPVFFVGFPRSGTTLMEQMLASHPGLISGDENDWLLSLLSELPGSVPQCLGQLTPPQIARLRSLYWDKARALHGEDLAQGRLVDKYPLNIVTLGLIQRLFPKAKVIVALRDPRDCVLSCFMQNFEANEGMAQFLDIDNAARFYVQTLDLYKHYRDVLPLDVMEYRYEELVEDTEAVLRRVLGFLGLEWDASVLAYADREQDRIVSTPSLRDVSQSVYSRSVGRWQRYRAQMAKALEVLEPTVQRLGYDRQEG